MVLGACANKEYGRTDHGKGAKYNVEFVSANPTGPMHMGNARGGALGDCLAAVLDWAGYDVTREFYINDAGNQIQKFGKSLASAICSSSAARRPIPCPPSAIRAATSRYWPVSSPRSTATPVWPPARDERRGVVRQRSLRDPEERPRGLRPAQEHCRPPARPRQVSHQLRCLVPREHPARVRRGQGRGGQAAGAGRLLQGRGRRCDVPQRPVRSQVWHRQQEEDRGRHRRGSQGRVLVRANGIPTYFAADIAYHYNKLATRGFAKAIDVWGADHHGHVARMKAPWTPSA